MGGRRMRRIDWILIPMFILGLMVIILMGGDLR
jgi:hypothetical protein